MFDVTPQERMALIVIATLITGGAAARHAVNRADARESLQFTSEIADTLSADSARLLRERVEAEVALERLRSTPLADGERLDPNSAPPEQLDRLPGIGPSIAERIAEHRRNNGRFRTLGDLGEVRGIGPAALTRLAPHVTLRDGPRTGGLGAPISRIDLNRASAEELVDLPGIGPSIAERVIDYREAHGPFREWHELENVSGIGPALRERLQSVARIGP